MTINRSVEFRARASNRRVKNQATPKTLILERGVVGAHFVNEDGSTTETIEITSTEALHSMLDKAGVQMDDIEDGYSFIDDPYFPIEAFELVPYTGESQNKQKVSKGPWKNRKMTMNRSVELKTRASNRRVKNREAPDELILEKGIVRAYFNYGDASLTETTEIEDIETLRDMLDKADVEMEDEGAAFSFIDSSEFDQDVFKLVPKTSES